jgi:hypothetical protein
MKKRILAVTSLALAALTSCVNLIEESPSASTADPELKTPRNATVSAQTSYGPPPSEGYESKIRSALGALLKDPASTPFQFEEPQHGSVACDLFDDVDAERHCREECLFGWTVRFHVGTKNRKPGCTGELPYEAFFQQGQLRGILRECKQKDVAGTPTWALLVSLPMAK